jgi:hydrogenase maturation protein HypF
MSSEPAPSGETVVRALVHIEGSVQGVGFRPYLYRLAVKHRVHGRVINTAAGVEIEAEGRRGAVESFMREIPREAPPMARITRIGHHDAPPVGHRKFVIARSDRSGEPRTLVAADSTVCDECLQELFDPRDRRFGYPMINCCQCGPRYTIVDAVPYDRASTSMACFPMCRLCQAEYDDPANRRFHAQPNACHQCGPHVWFVPADGSAEPVGSHQRPRDPSAVSHDAIARAIGWLKEGRIIAVKGLGGFHLACDALNNAAVRELRRRKQRDEKPFAIMAADPESARRLGEFSPHDEQLLASRERPITLVGRRQDSHVADAVAPGSPYLGIMLPYTPLHHLIMRSASGEARFAALVMTSGNHRDEPLAAGNRQAIQQLQGLADAFLCHNRDVRLRADDSVVRSDSGRPVFFRRSRGYVPRPVSLPRDIGEVLGVGAHLKNTVALSRGRNVFLSQHIGDLESLEGLEFLRRTVEHLKQILGVSPAVVGHDLHPDYLSTRFAQRMDGVRCIAVQHHHAHIASSMADHALAGPVVGIVLDGTGLGPDGTIWGGEILVADYRTYHREAHLRHVPLPGGGAAVRHPWRMALAQLDQAWGDSLWQLRLPLLKAIDRPAAELVLRAARQAINSPLTSSCGRLFDAIAAICGICRSTSYEGQAAVELESLLGPYASWPDRTAPYSFDIADRHVQADAMQPAETSISSAPSPLIIDSVPAIRQLIDDVVAGRAMRDVSLSFHDGLVDVLGRAAEIVSRRHGIRQVVLSGGCFQNRYLATRLPRQLAERGLEVFTHRQVPPGDGGIALGQVMVAAHCEADAAPGCAGEVPNRDVIDTVVGGIGSPHGDDQLGWRVLDLVLRQLPSRTRALKVRTPIELLDRLEPTSRLIVIDACRTGAPPGTVHRWLWPGELPRAGSSRIGHGMDLIAALTLASQLGRLPPRVIVYGVEANAASDSDRAMGEISIAGRRVLERAKRAILAEIG